MSASPAVAADGTGVAPWKREFRQRYAEMAQRRGLADTSLPTRPLGAAPRLIRIK